MEMMRAKTEKGSDDFLIVPINTLAGQALRNYRKRPAIETGFRDFKKQGFHLENTHLKAPHKIVKLLYLLSVAYYFCVHTGLPYGKKEGAIPRQKHGYRAPSLFRKGLDRLRGILHRKNDQAPAIWHSLVDKFIHLMLVRLLKINKL